MSNSVLLVPIVAPVILALFVFLIPQKLKWIREALTFLGAAINLIFIIVEFGKDLRFNANNGVLGMTFSLRLYSLSSFILLMSGILTFLIVIYTISFMKGKELPRLFYGFLLLAITLLNGTVLANNLVVLLFFCESLLVTLFGMIIVGGKKAFPVGIKAFVISGVADLCMMLGVGITIYLSNGISSMEKIHVVMSPLGTFAFILLIIGATAKAGAMPFHSWIPDAAVEAPLPFMALFPAVFEKLLGIYILARITLDLFVFTAGSSMSIMLMTLGSITIIFAVLMAVIQKDYKKLLAYCAISQVGYMILGIGTALPIGIIGGLFHMVNHAMYKSCLFLTAGSVEKQTKTTDLKKLGGLARKMPVTFICFMIAALSMSGVPPFNAFFSKEMIFDSAMQSGWVFYVVALAGVFFTVAAILKLGHTAFFGKATKESENAKEAPLMMLIPTVAIAAGCILFGVYNTLPLKYLIEPALKKVTGGESFAGFPKNMVMVLVSVVVIILAVLNHFYGVRKARSTPLGATDHIRYAKGLKTVYDMAEKRYFDPYDIGMFIVGKVAKVLFYIDRGIDWFYSVFIVSVVTHLSHFIKKAHNGSHIRYIIWALFGIVLIIVIAIYF